MQMALREKQREHLSVGPHAGESELGTICSLIGACHAQKVFTTTTTTTTTALQVIYSFFFTPSFYFLLKM